ncbi:MAG: aldo/keto reductase [Pseudomonadota bacterium]
MQRNRLGNLFDVSALTLGGGGIGQVWGDTTQAEAVDTVLAAYQAGITFFDMAPLYGDGEAERVMGLAFADGYPGDVRITTKCMLGPITSDQIEARLRTSLEESFTRLQRQFVDVFILHGFVIPDGWDDAIRPAALPHISVPYSTYVDVVVPVFEALIAEGKIGAFGVTAASIQASNLAVLNATPAPAVVQCITNVLDSPGGMAIADEPPQPRAVIAAAKDRGIGVMGIRAVAAGALTAGIDRSVKPHSAEAKDYARAEGFRALAGEMGVSAAALAHRYALSMPGVDTVVLGVKNRAELEECLQAEGLPRLTASEMHEIEQVVGATA